MHIVVLSLIVSLAVSLLLLGAFALFTITPLGRRIEEAERRRVTPGLR